MSHCPGLAVLVGRGLRIVTSCQSPATGGVPVSLDFTHLARPQVRNLSQLSLGSLVLDQLGISGQRDEVGLKPHGQFWDPGLG